MIPLAILLVPLVIFQVFQQPLIGRVNIKSNSSFVTSELRINFLIDKKVMDVFPARRDEEIRLLNRPDLAPIQMQAHYTKCQERLNRILSVMISCNCCCPLRVLSYY